MRKIHHLLTFALLTASIAHLSAQDWIDATATALREANTVNYTYSPELKEITDAYLEANGGLEAYRKTISMYVEGSYETNNSTFQIRIIKANPNRQANFIANDQFRQLTLFDGNRITISTNLSEPPTLTKEEARELFRDAPIFDILFRQIIQQGPITLEGSKTIDGIACTVLSIPLEENLTAHFYLDSDYLIVKKDTIRTKPDGTTSTTTIHFSDYKRLEGIPVAMTQATTTDDEPAGTFTTSLIQFNIPVVAAMFTPEYWFDKKEPETTTQPVPAK